MSHQSTPHLYNKRTPGSIQNDNHNASNFNNSSNNKPIMDSSISICDSQATNARQLLNAYVYDFLVKSRLPQTARIFVNEAEVPSIQNSSNSSNKNSPQTSNNSNTPQTPNSSYQQFQKENNLPNLLMTMDAPQGFLYEWWQVFWDVFQAKNNKGTSNFALQYYQLQSLKQRQQQEMQGLNVQALGVPNGGQFHPQPQQQPQQPHQQIPPQHQPQALDQQQQQRLMMQMMMKQQQLPIGSMDPQQQMLATMAPNNNLNLQQQLFLSHQQQSQNRIQQHAQSQMNNLRQQAAVAAQQQQQQVQQAQQIPHDSPNNSSPANGQRLNQMTPQTQHAQQPINGMQPFQQPQIINGSQAPTPFNQPQPPPQIIRMNSNSNPSMSNQNNDNQTMLTSNANNNGTSRNTNALQDYQMQLMLLEKQNKKRLDIARNNGAADPNALLGSGMLPPQSQQNQQSQQKSSPAPITNSPVINNKPSPSSANTKKKKEQPAKRGRKPSTASNPVTNTANIPGSNIAGTNISANTASNASLLKKEYSTPLTPASENSNDTLAKRKRKSVAASESPKKQANKNPSNPSITAKKEKPIKEESTKKNKDEENMPPPSVSSTFQDSIGQTDQMFPVEILGNNSNGDNHNFFGTNTQPSHETLDDIDFDFNQFLDGNGDSTLNESIGGFSWGNVDAIENGE